MHIAMYWGPAIREPFHWPAKPKVSALIEPEVRMLFQHNRDHMIFLLTFQGCGHIKIRLVCISSGGLRYLLHMSKSPI